MNIKITHQSKEYNVDLGAAMDISIPLKSGANGPKCFYAPDFKIEPVVAGDFIGAVENGSPVNFKNIFLNPHGNGTHTECAGHITSAPFTIHQCLTEFHFVAQLVTVTPDVITNGDLVISKEVLCNIAFSEINTLIIRTLPNENTKLIKDYSGTNPPYFSQEAILFLNDLGIRHLITDLPSIDREEDGGALDGHKAFWGFPDFPDKSKTITEMVYVDDTISDGLYFCNIQIASIESDASPSKILLFHLSI